MMSRRAGRLLTVAAAAIVLSAAGCRRAIVNLESRSRVVVCVGDSLTAGEGAAPGEDYPSALARCAGADVVNAGVSGDTTRDGLARFERDVLARSPGLVVIEFGANDFFGKIPRSETMANLDRMAAAAQRAGAAVALLSVRVTPVGDPYGAGMAEICRRRGCVFVRDILSGIIADPSLKSDQIHPNAKGYDRIARRVCAAIAPWTAAGR